MSNLRLIIFSDLHYTDEEQNWETKRKLVEQAEPILEKLIEILNKYKILGIFCGHHHWTKILNNNSINCYMLGSLVEKINNGNMPDGVYFDVLVDKNNLEVEEKHIII